MVDVALFTILLLRDLFFACLDIFPAAVVYCESVFIKILLSLLSSVKWLVTRLRQAFLMFVFDNVLSMGG